MIDHPTTIYLSGGIKREGIDRLVVEHVVRYTRGGYPKQVFLNEIKGIDTKPESQGYEPSTGTYRTVFKVEAETDPDVKVPFAITGSYVIAGEKYPTPFEHNEKLRIPEPALVVKSPSFKFHDDKFVVTLKVRRTNGKIPKFACFDGEAEPTGNLVSNKIVSQTYNPITGELVGEYQAKSKAMYADMKYQSAVRSLPTQPGAVVSFEGRLERTKTINYKVISKVLKEKTLHVMMEVKWADTGLPPSSFSLVTPFLYGNNVPTGIVQPNTINYDPQTGLYEFGIAVSVIPEGTVDYNFITKAKAEDYPAIDFNLTVNYTHQSTYRANVESVTFGSDIVQVRFSVNSKEDWNYKLQNLQVPPADFVSNLMGNLSPRVDWIPGTNEFIASWEVATDISRQLTYKLRGHFIIDNKPVSWMTQTTVNPIAIYGETVIRDNKESMSYEFSLVSDSKIKSIDATTLHLLVNRIPSPIKIIQNLDTSSNKATGHFELPAQTSEAVEVEIIGSVVVETGVFVKVPLHLKTVDYIPEPEGGTELHYEVMEHSVVNDVEKVVLRPTFADGTSPVALELIGNRIELNGVEVVAPKVVYRNNLLTILFKFNPTGLAETHVVKGKTILPGYESPLETPFQSTVKFGSDNFPAAFNKSTVVIGDHLIVKITPILKDHSLPTDVKLLGVEQVSNVYVEKTVDYAQSFDAKAGTLTFNIKCKPIDNEQVKYMLTAKLEIVGTEGSHVQSVSVSETHKPKPRYWTELAKYEVKDDRIIFTHQLKSNTAIPRALSVVKPDNMENYPMNFEYNFLTGEIKHSRELGSLKEVANFNIDFIVDVVGTNYSAEVSTGDFYYGPAAAATELDHKFDKGILTYRWLFRDALGGIPKLVRIDDFWKHNVNIEARKIDLIYDRQTGIGYVKVKATEKPTKGTSFFADAIFRFPSPDVNFYPLVISIDGTK